ncbi:MAG: calcium/sodium antiporter [Desulfovibrionaceae bacterium]
MELVIDLISIVLGLYFLVWSADKFVIGSVATATLLQLHPLIIGMVVIGFGTSMPELLVSIIAMTNNSSGISFGNVLGSNITNITLAFPIPALFYPVLIDKKILSKEFPFLLIISCLSLLFLWNLVFSRMDAFIFLIIFIFFIAQSFYGAKQNPPSIKNDIPQGIPNTPMKALLYLVGGLLLLIISSRILIFGAVGLAELFGISELIIGLTIVAIGTSLPELVSSYIAIKKGELNLAIGNVLGSNLFNILLVLGITGIISPTNVDHVIVYRDIIAMVAFTFLFYFLVLFNKGRLTKIGALVLILCYIFYIISLILFEITPHIFSSFLLT